MSNENIQNPPFPRPLKISPDQQGPAQSPSPLAKVDPSEMNTRLASMFNHDDWFLSIVEDLERGMV